MYSNHSRYQVSVEPNNFPKKDISVEKKRKKKTKQNKHHDIQPTRISLGKKFQFELITFRRDDLNIQKTFTDIVNNSQIPKPFTYHKSSLVKEKKS